MAKATIQNLEINHSDVPIRLFKSGFLETLTHVHPAVIVVLWVPVMLFFVFRALGAVPASAPATHVPVGAAFGLMIWTLSEYVLHRFVFHYEPTAEWQTKVWYLFHGIHHEQPQCKTRLVMPPAVSIPLGIFFYGLFALVVGRGLGARAWVDPLFAGFVLGYLIYDLTHYASHHLPMRWGPLKYIKRYHLLHHYKTPEHRFGVSSPFWDIVFGTNPKDR